jgi:hypothetical protein
VKYAWDEVLRGHFVDGRSIKALKKDVEGTDRRGDRSRDRRVEAKSTVEWRAGEERKGRIDRDCGTMWGTDGRDRGGDGREDGQ